MSRQKIGLETKELDSAVSERIKLIGTWEDARISLFVDRDNGMSWRRIKESIIERLRESGKIDEGRTPENTRLMYEGCELRDDNLLCEDYIFKHACKYNKPMECTMLSRIVERAEENTTFRNRVEVVRDSNGSYVNYVYRREQNSACVIL